MTTLAELRQASLQEQRDQREQASAESEAAATDAAHKAAAHTQTAPAETPAPVHANGAHANGTVHTSPQAAIESAPLPLDPAQTAGAEFLGHVRAALSRKTTHRPGVKVTVDMDPQLFHRAKRYCLDHGNITLRQVSIDLLTAYLDEEGY